MPALELTFDRAPRFVLLLLSIITELMLTPFLVDSAVGLHVAQALGVFILGTALWAAGGGRSSVALFVPTIFANLLAAYGGSAPMHVVAVAFRILFFGYMTGLIIWRTMRRADVTIDTIAGAACAYTLLAVLWGNAYVLLEFVRPGSFAIPSAWLLGASHDPRAALVYFSFVTLTTVGYGDITPLRPGAGGLAVAEAVVGQLYLAITIARLVGLHASQHTR